MAGQGILGFHDRNPGQSVFRTRFGFARVRLAPTSPELRLLSEFSCCGSCGCHFRTCPGVADVSRVFWASVVSGKHIFLRDMNIDVAVANCRRIEVLASLAAVAKGKKCP